MKLVPQIKDAYDWAISQNRAELVSALAINNAPAIARLNAIRDFLDRGAYVLLFGQFENDVNDHFAAALAKRTSNPDWTRRRGWDVPALAGKKVPFDTRLALTLDRTSSAYTKVMAAYSNRNHCAHGGMTVAVGSIDQFVADLTAWSRLLRS
jgi:hypothetical protein